VDESIDKYRNDERWEIGSYRCNCLGDATFCIGNNDKHRMEVLEIEVCLVRTTRACVNLVVHPLVMEHRRPIIITYHDDGGESILLCIKLTKCWFDLQGILLSGLGYWYSFVQINTGAVVITYK
jgi:hypothetical protein